VNAFNALLQHGVVGALLQSGLFLYRAPSNRILVGGEDGKAAFHRPRQIGLERSLSKERVLFLPSAS